MPTNTRSNRLTVDKPTRDAAENQSLINRADPATDDILFPSLDAGVTLLDIEESRGVTVLQSLVLDHLLLHEGPTFWIDANGHATTTTLAQLAPSRRLLDRINVARGFTAYQHYSAVDNLQAAVTQSIQQSTTGDTPRRSPGRTDDESPHMPSLIVVPAVDAQYRNDDTLTEEHAATLQARTLAQLVTYADGYDVPVLITRSTVDEFTAPVKRTADHYLQCKQTKLGPRFVGEEFETLVYPVDDGTYYQTTFAYWRQLLEARATQAGLDPVTPPASQTTAIGLGVTVDGETASLTGNPLLDAWTAAGGR